MNNKFKKNYAILPKDSEFYIPLEPEKEEMFGAAKERWAEIKKILELHGEKQNIIDMVEWHCTESVIYGFKRGLEYARHDKYVHTTIPDKMAEQ